MRTEDIQRLMWRIYPYMRDELFLRWREDEVISAVLETLDDLANHGLLEAVDAGTQWRVRRPDRPRPCSCRCSRT